MNQMTNRTNFKFAPRHGSKKIGTFRSLSRAARIELAAAQEEDIKVSIFGNMADDIERASRRIANLDRA